MTAETTTLCPKHMKALLDAKKLESALHDHSAHQSTGMNHNQHHEMIMSFHDGFKEVILFDFWKTNTVTIFLLSCFILMVLAVLYEGLKLVREKLLQHDLLKKQSHNLYKRQNQPSSNCNCDHEAKNNNLNDEKNNLLVVKGISIDINNEEENAAVNQSKSHDCCSRNKVNTEEQTVVVKSYSSRLFSKAHMVQTLLHVLQITISYLLMLVFMTYNSWLCLSVVIGAGIGYFLFGFQRYTSIDVNECCH